MNSLRRHQIPCLALLMIVLNLVPHSSQRYDTVGDWVWQGDTLKVSVSREVGASNPDYVTLVFIHETVEAILTRHAHISGSRVDAFDMSYKGGGEPGDSPKAPYHHEHQVATKVEHEIADALGVNWAEYEKALDSVSHK